MSVFCLVHLQFGSVFGTDCMKYCAVAIDTNVP